MSEQVKHTPGPWKAILPKEETDPDYDEGNEEHSMIAVVMGSRLQSPSCYSTAHEIIMAEGVAPNENPEMEANAVLIAKAPEMYDAIQRKDAVIRELVEAEEVVPMKR